MPFAAPGFVPDTPAAGDLAARITQVVIDDLTGTGLFREIPASAHIGKIGNFDAPVAFADWKAINAQALITGAVGLKGDKAQVRFRLWDVFAQAGLGEGLQFEGSTGSWRRLAHKVADAVYSRLTGESGYFDSKVAYIAASGPKEARRKQLAIMDYDGANPVMLTNGDALVLTPRLSPDARRVLYTSYEQGAPKVMMMQAGGGSKTVIDDTSGMTFAPRFSPDGKRAVFSKSAGTGSNLYVTDLGGRGDTQLTRGSSIDTGPAFSPDGNQIVFESDRSGEQQNLCHAGFGRRAQPDQLRRRALRDAGLVAAGRHDRLHQDRRRAVLHRRDACRRIGREAPDRQLPRRGSDLGAERTGADVLPRDARRRWRAAALFGGHHRAEPEKGSDGGLCLRSILVGAAELREKPETSRKRGRTVKTKVKIGALLGLVFLVAGCAGGGDVTVPGDMGFGGTEGSLGGAGGFGASDAIGGGTLPGSTISDRVHFTVDQTTLDAQAIGILDAQVGWLKQNASAPILIEGHADERGTSEYNMALGSSRASAVRNYMVSQGIPDGRISIITYGRERPIATCADESCFAQNRRAVTVVTSGAGA